MTQYGKGNFSSKHKILTLNLDQGFILCILFVAYLYSSTINNVQREPERVIVTFSSLLKCNSYLIILYTMTDIKNAISDVTVSNMNIMLNISE